MDPVSPVAIAALGALEAYFRFLCTVEGQKFSADVRQLTWDRLVALIPAGTTPPGK